jgi:hypothetical protein
MHPLTLCRALLIVCLALAATAANAQQTAKISDLRPVDIEFMAQQRGRIDQLARFNLGKQLRAEKANDLDILQTLLDRGVVRPQQTLELQAMGVVMGDLLAAEMNMVWVVYEDRYGRSRALKLKNSDNYLFPITMISRRAEVGAAVRVQQIYDKALGLMQPFTRSLPFQ